MEDDYSELAGDEVLGEDDDIVTEGYDVIGAAPRGRLALRSAPRRLLRLPRRPRWRHGMVAPGVMAPYQGLQPLPLTPLAAGGVFALATPNITFQGQPQRPFRSERLLADIRRTAGAAGVPVTAQIFVGTALQALDIGGISLDFFGATAFGVRLALSQAEPGMLIRMLVSAPGIAAGESITVTLTILGRTIA